MKAMRWGAVTFALLLCAGACDQSHARSTSSGSNWLRCETVADCSTAEDAVACENGYCVDEEGDRIGLRSDGGEPRENGPCAWGVDELLQAAGTSADGRGNCGNFNSVVRNEPAVGVALECFSNAAAAGQAVELTVYACIDGCAIPTYVANARGELFAVVMDQGTFSGDRLRRARVDACAAIEPAESMVELACVDPVELYACEETLGTPMEAPPPPPFAPLKLADVPLPPGTTAVPLHLYVSNQSFEHSLVGIEVYIDGTHVVGGDFDVGGQHNWFEFEIEVPAGTRAVRAFGTEGGAEHLEQIEVPAERWAVLDYWYDGEDDAEGAHFTLTVSDVPVSFD